jgi:hypothetical protein
MANKKLLGGQSALLPVADTLKSSRLQEAMEIAVKMVLLRLLSLEIFDLH